MQYFAKYYENTLTVWSKRKIIIKNSLKNVIYIYMDTISIYDNTIYTIYCIRFSNLTNYYCFKIENNNIITLLE